MAQGRKEEEDSDGRFEQDSHAQSFRPSVCCTRTHMMRKLGPTGEVSCSRGSQGWDPDFLAPRPSFSHHPTAASCLHPEGAPVLALLRRGCYRLVPFPAHSVPLPLMFCGQGSKPLSPQ